MSPDPLLSVSGLTKRFSDKRTIVDKVRKQEPAVLTALDDVDLVVESGGDPGGGRRVRQRQVDPGALHRQAP